MICMYAGFCVLFTLHAINNTVQTGLLSRISVQRTGNKCAEKRDSNRFSRLMPWVSQNIATQASFHAGNSAFLISAFPNHLTVFPSFFMVTWRLLWRELNLNIMSFDELCSFPPMSYRGETAQFIKWHIAFDSAFTVGVEYRSKEKKMGGNSRYCEKSFLFCLFVCLFCSCFSVLIAQLIVFEKSTVQFWIHLEAYCQRNYSNALRNLGFTQLNRQIFSLFVLTSMWTSSPQLYAAGDWTSEIRPVNCSRQIF